MDKRKGIILAIVLFLIIGLGTFVFAGSDEEPEDGTIPSQSEGENGSENNPSDSNEEINDGNLTGEGGTEKPSRDDVTTPVVDEVETPVTDGNNANTIDWASLLNELAQMVNTAEDRKDIEAAIEFRKNNNITAENIESLGETALDSLKTVNAILDDETAPAIEPDLDGKFFKEVSISINDDTKYTFVLERLDGESIPEGTTLDNINLEGEYKLTVVDAAFNETVVTFTIDRNETEETKTAMDVANTTHFDSIEDAVATITDLSLDKVVVENQDTKESVTFVAENGNVEIKLTEEATYKLTAYDKAGNETTYWLAVDETDPTIFFTDSEGNELSALTNKNVTITAFDKFLTEVTVTYPDGSEEVYTYANNDFELASGAEKRTYTATFEEEGTYKVTAKDKVGRTIKETIEIDKTKIEVNHLYVLNNSHNEMNYNGEDKYQVIGIGQDLYVEYVLKEEFATTPILTIGGKTYEMTCNTASWNDELYKCDVHVTISADMSLTHNEVIPFTISGVKDAAGTETIVTEENVASTEKYGQVKFDGKAPKYSKLGILNVDHLRSGEDVTVINLGEEIRVLFNFSEILGVNPKMTIGESKTIYELKLTEDYDNFAKYTYVADIKINEDMNLANGDLVYTIFGYADAAGNVGKTIYSTDSDIKVYSQYPGVKYDTTAGIIELNGESQIVLEAGIDEYAELGATVTDNIDGEKQLTPAYIHYSKNGYFIDEVPSVDYMKTGTYKIVYKYTDAAGNASVDANRPDHDYVIRTVIVKDETKPLLTLNGSSTIKLEYGIDEYDELGATVTDNVDETITNLTPTQIKFNGKIIDDISSVKFDQIGTYKLTYTYTDSNGNLGVSHKNPELNGVVRTVIVKDETKPLLTLNGSSTIKLEYGIDEYDELGATVTDNFDAPITNLTPTQIKFNGKIIEDISSVKFDQIGTYKLTYTYTDSNGNVGVSYKNPELNGVVRTVIVKDETKPLLKLNGDSTIRLINGKDNYIELGATVTDNFDAPITNLAPTQIKFNGKIIEDISSVKFDQIGTYKLIYTSTDSNGNVGVSHKNPELNSVVRTVIVMSENTTSLVDGVSYESLSDAVEAAKASGSTVELVDDITVSTSDYIEIKNGEVNIDLNGNNIMFESSRFSISDNGTLNLTGEGTISSNVAGGGPIYLSGSTDSSATAYANLNVGKDVTVEGNNGILIFTIDGKRGNAYGVNVNIDGTVRAIDVDNAPANIGVYVTGNLRNATTNAPIITLSETARVESGGVGIYAAGYATWNINGAYIEGAESAVGIKSGILNMNSGTLKANGTLNIPTEPFGNGMNSSGAALQIESNASYVGEMEINISGGRLISENAVAIYEYGQKDIDTKVQKINITGGEFISTNYKENFLFSTSFNDTFNNGFITGGTFNRNENDALLQYIADGYTVVEQDGNYVVVAE